MCAKCEANSVTGRDRARAELFSGGARTGLEGRAAAVPVGGALVGLRQGEHGGLGPVRGAQLQADRRPSREKPQGTEMAPRLEGGPPGGGGNSAIFDVYGLPTIK